MSEKTALPVMTMVFEAEGSVVPFSARSERVQLISLEITQDFGMKSSMSEKLLEIVMVARSDLILALSKWAVISPKLQLRTACWKLSELMCLMAVPKLTATASSLSSVALVSAELLPRLTPKVTNWPVLRKIIERPIERRTAMIQMAPIPPPVKVRKSVVAEVIVRMPAIGRKTLNQLRLIREKMATPARKKLRMSQPMAMPPRLIGVKTLIATAAAARRNSTPQKMWPVFRRGFCVDWFLVVLDMDVLSG